GRARSHLAPERDRLVTLAQRRFTDVAHRDAGAKESVNRHRTRVEPAFGVVLRVHQLQRRREHHVTSHRLPERDAKLRKIDRTDARRSRILSDAGGVTCRGEWLYFTDCHAVIAEAQGGKRDRESVAGAVVGHWRFRALAVFEDGIEQR